MSIDLRNSPAHPAERALVRHASGPRAPGWWGMVMLIVTEAMLFGSLIAAYFYIRFGSDPVWPPEGIETPSLELPLIMTAILFSSSIPVHMADRAVRRGNQFVLRWGLLVGFLLGAAFMSLQLGIEYPEKLQEFSPTDHAYGSLFYTITGFHGMHVLVGLALSVWVQIRAWRGAFDEHRHVTVQNFVLYWHFVDAVWAAVLATVYLSPNF
ncbi:MAG: cytochrome c oxidase subunit 3 [Actinomycetota bacterium]